MVPKSIHEPKHSVYCFPPVKIRNLLFLPYGPDVITPTLITTTSHKTRETSLCLLRTNFIKNRILLHHYYKAL